MQATSATTIQPGTRLGPYEIVAPIGAGCRQGVAPAMPPPC